MWHDFIFGRNNKKKFNSALDGAGNYFISDTINTLIKENQKIWIHKVSAPKSVDDFEEKLFNYNNIDNKLKLSKSGD